MPTIDRDLIIIKAIEAIHNTCWRCQNVALASMDIWGKVSHGVDQTEAGTTLNPDECPAEPIYKLLISLGINPVDLPQ